MTETQTTRTAEERKAEFEALLAQADNDTLQYMLIYAHILQALEEPGAPAEAQRLNAEMQAELTARTLTAERHKAYISAMCFELDSLQARAMSTLEAQAIEQERHAAGEGREDE